MRIISWEYLVRKLNDSYTADEFTKKLNAFGVDGYEFVSVVQLSENGGNYVIFKKPIGYINI